MSYGFLLILVDLTLVVHAARTGRASPWILVILMLPGLGGLAYVVVELVPEWLGTPQARRARNSFTKAVKPTRRYREAKDQLTVVDTIANRSALAEEALAIGRNDEALSQYQAIVAMPMGDEPGFYLGLARAQFGLGDFHSAAATLEEIKRRWPDYNSADGHLLYARALEGEGRNDEALANYDAVGRYYPGAEARVRQAQLLAKIGRAAEAKAIAATIVAGLERAPAHVRRSQREWLNIARSLNR